MQRYGVAATLMRQSSGNVFNYDADGLPDMSMVNDCHGTYVYEG